MLPGRFGEHASRVEHRDDLDDVALEPVDQAVGPHDELAEIWATELWNHATQLGELEEPAGSCHEAAYHETSVQLRVTRDVLADGFEVGADPSGGFRVRGRRIERLAAQTNFEIEESAERFQRDLERLGIDAELRRAGVRPGDTVRIGAVELEWEPVGWDQR